MTKNSPKVAAIVLAAGMSQRMGTPKMALPWKGSTVLGTVITVIHNAGVEQISVVTGASRDLVEGILDGMHFPVTKSFNPNYRNGEMMDSIKVGISGLGSTVKAVLFALGDQPQIEATVVSKLLDRYEETGHRLIVPGYQQRRGHPWLIGRKFWKEIQRMGAGQTMRDFFTLHAGEIDYIEVDSPGVMQDLDTPEDYRKAAGL